MGIIIRVIIATIIAMSMGLGLNNVSTTNTIENSNVTMTEGEEAFNDYSMEDEDRIDCHVGNEFSCLHYVKVVGEDSFWADSDGNITRVPFIHAAYYMDRGSLSMDYYDEWLEAFKAKICAAEDDMATCVADIESMNEDAMSR